MATTLPHLTLNAQYPCCKGKCRITAIIDVNRETYDRKCPRCGQKYTVERSNQPRYNAHGCEYRVDVVTFTAVKPDNSPYRFGLPGARDSKS